jgi:hypothetical protein
VNSETGKAYEEPKSVAAALARGEKLVPVSRAAARRIRFGRMLLAQELKARRKRKKNRTRDRLQKASRKANR